MGIQELFSGIAIVVDDEVNDPQANIANIIKQMEKCHIPVLRYTDILDENKIKHFKRISFLLLDWQLNPGQEIGQDMAYEGVKLPSALDHAEVLRKIAFIKKLNEVCFCPIFIFTNEDKSHIKNMLLEAELITETYSHNLFIASRSNLQGRTKLLKEIKNWLEHTPSIYVLKEWENKYHASIHKLFWDFQKTNPFWPKIMRT